MTTKQIKTLVLFAQNYSLQIVAKKQKVSLATIRERVKSLSKNHQREFNNALALRESYKRARHGLRTASRCGLGIHRDFNNDIEFERKF